MKKPITETYSQICGLTLQLRTLLSGLAVFCSVTLIMGQPTNGLVAWYTFSGNANDGSGNGNHGTVNGATLTTDRFGNANSAYSFDGNDYINIGDFSEGEDGVFTYSAWINTTQTGGGNWIVSEGNTSNNTPIVGIVNDNGRGRTLYRNNSNNSAVINGTTVINDGTWHHIAVTSNGSALKLYVDGVQEGGNVSMPSGTTTLNAGAIGRLTRSSSCCNVSGKIDEVGIWNRALSSSEINQLYGGGGGSTPTCSDGIQNGNETGVDCGGSCPACPTCNDGIQNQGETSVDCGGPCPACSTCNDGIKNGNETGVDCGGSCPNSCPSGEAGLWTSGSSSKIYYNAGFVGIGTNNPLARLTVDGSIMGKEVRVKSSVSSYPDYVFNTGYRLRTLENLEEYIQNNRHLPDMPTASEVARDGMDLGEMNRKLLQKIEELTLYTIDQQKEIEELRQRITELEKRIQK